jgi:class 3 adenylate cyclase
MSGDVLAVLAGCLTWALMARCRRVGAARRHRRFARNPAPTFVFADLVGYGALTERHGDDGAMICVPDAGRAVALAERTLTAVGGHPDLLPVRVGAHTGSAVLHDGDWYGSAVNVAARLVDAARPNEALVSDTTRDAAGIGVRRFLSGRHEVGLRGVRSPMGVWPLARDRRNSTNQHHQHVLRGVPRGPR